MIELLEQVNFWHWLALGLALLLLELLGAAGYLLWLGISAMAIGALLAILPLSWQMQWLTFAALSLFTTWIWWRYQHRSDRKSDANRTLNKRMDQLIGQQITLEHDIKAGADRIQLGDTTWSVRANEPIAAGTLIEVVAVDGIVLIIVPKR